MSTREKMLAVEENIARVLVGKERPIRLVLVSLLAGGHVLLEDLPGSGKTMLAKSLAKSADIPFRRIQFTPDLLPTDITGLSVWQQNKGEFVFQPGPVFTSILLADEINRATPRTQAGLLECMEERQVTTDGVTRTLPEPFFVLATQNPVETSGTFPLPEAQLDRFLMKLSVGFPDRNGEVEVLKRFLSANAYESLSSVASAEDFLAAREEAARVTISEEILGYIADLIIATRKLPELAAGASPRASLALMRASRAMAYLAGRSFVVPEDVKELAVPVLAHRLVLAHRFGAGTSAEDLVKRILTFVPVPTENFGNNDKHEI
ncbi:MAG: AAA family ATPase [Lachnospiraceae bacterium]